MMEQVVAEYERRMREVYEKYVDGWISPHEISDERSRIIRSLVPKVGRRREFLNEISRIDRELKEKSLSEILKLTLHPAEIKRMNEVYSDHNALRRRLERIADCAFIEEADVPVGVCFHALARTEDRKVLCNHREEIADCTLLVLKRVEDRFAGMWDGPPPVIYYKCPIEGKEIPYVPLGYWDWGLHPCYSERVSLLKQHQKPGEFLTLIGLACLRFPYSRKLIKKFSPDYLQLVRDLDASDELTYVNLLPLEEAVGLLWEAFLKKPQPMLGL